MLSGGKAITSIGNENAKNSLITKGAKKLSKKQKQREKKLLVKKDSKETDDASSIASVNKETEDGESCFDEEEITIEPEDLEDDFIYASTARSIAKSMIDVNRNNVPAKPKKHDTSKETGGKNGNRDRISDDFFAYNSNHPHTMKGNKPILKGVHKTPEGFGGAALNAIKMGHYKLAIAFLTEAIALDPYDRRHYINRSYCFLRIGNYGGALTDLEYAENVADARELAKVKCKEGRALAALGEYDAAELAFYGCIELEPGNLYAQLELTRIRVSKLVNMGFNERSVLLALMETSDLTVEGALNILTNGAQLQTDALDYETDVDDVYFSETEDDPSNTTLLSQLANYDPDLPEPPEPEPPVTINNNVPPAASSTRNLKVIQPMALIQKPKPNPFLNEMAVYVQNLTPSITEAMLRQKFKTFGKVTGVYMNPMKPYAFVNFLNASSVQKALDEARCNSDRIEMNDGYVIVKPATKSAKYIN